MKLLKSHLVKAEILEQLSTTRNWQTICSYSTEIANIELFHFIKIIEVGGMIEIITGKELNAVTLTKLSKLYNIRVLFKEHMHAKVYLNESSAILTSCNFGGLLISRYSECGISFLKRDYPIEYKSQESQINEWKENAKVVLPMLPFKPYQPLDLKSLLK